ncbi:bifunctional epoxide hydrolase 2-like isoform X2 [Apostichopus japonicus]|uniref:bifunctional epoxide hydrolase 2-like isoform X2 n=1 Tax=Stichopus japonicus TaxID=307972 RepID=UPI003AB31FD4
MNTKPFSLSHLQISQATTTSTMVAKKAVIFDLGGVIVEQPQKALEKFGEKLKLPKFFFESVMIKGRPNNAFCQMERGEISVTQFCDAFEKECHTYADENNVTLSSSFTGHDLFLAFSQTLPVPEMINAIGVLKNKGMKLCLLTNNYIDDTSERSIMAAGLMNLRFLFDHVMESCRLGLRKPDPKLFEEACSKMNVAPNETIFLDDIGPNVKAARDLGISTILVKDHNKALQELKQLSGIDVFQRAMPIACQPKNMCEGDVVTKDGVKIHFFEMGQGPPVILCHGFPEGWYSWRRQMPALAMSGYRAIALEMKGYGESSAPPEPSEYGMDKITRDVVAFMDVLGLPQATFIGHDWGGVAVWSLALHYPERTMAVGAFNTPFFPPILTSANPLENMKKKPGVWAYQIYFQDVGIAEAEIGPNLERFFKLMVRASLKEDYFPGFEGINFLSVLEKGGILVDTPEDPPHSILYDKDELDYSLDRIRKSGLRGMLNWYRNINESAEWNAKAAGRKILCPALMVTAEKDPVLTPSASRHMDDWIPDLSRGHLDCGHWSLLERPAEANQILLEWLNKVHCKQPQLMALL